VDNYIRLTWTFWDRERGNSEHFKESFGEKHMKTWEKQRRWRSKIKILQNLTDFGYQTVRAELPCLAVAVHASGAKKAGGRLIECT